MVWNYQNADYSLKKNKFIASFIAILGTLSFPIPGYANASADSQTGVKELNGDATSEVITGTSCSDTRVFWCRDDVPLFTLECDVICTSVRGCCRRRAASAKSQAEQRTDKKLSYRRGTARCVVSIEILPIATQQCRNYLYDESWPNRWHEVGDLVGGNAW